MPIPLIPIAAALGAGTIGFFIGREMASKSEGLDCLKYSGDENQDGFEDASTATPVSGTKTSEEEDPEPMGMSKAEALGILDLAADATTDAIAESHRRLVQRLDPEQGGSSHLVEMVDRAKTVLLS